VDEDLVFLTKILLCTLSDKKEEEFWHGSRVVETALTLADIVLSTDFMLVKAMMMIFPYYAYLLISVFSKQHYLL
jgi:hypothetical protein